MTTTDSTDAPAAVPTSAFLANEYFDQLLQRPDGQCPALRLTDLGMKLRPEDEKELVEFGDALQKRLAAFVKGAPAAPVSSERHSEIKEDFTECASIFANIDVIARSVFPGLDWNDGVGTALIESIALLAQRGLNEIEELQEAVCGQEGGENADRVKTVADEPIELARAETAASAGRHYIIPVDAFDSAAADLQGYAAILRTLAASPSEYDDAALDTIANGIDRVWHSLVDADLRAPMASSSSG